MTNDVALEITGLNKRFGGLPATRDAHLKVKKGERRLIIGPNGAGKTTLFNQITGDLRPDSGSIRLYGEELIGKSTSKRVALGLSRTYQILTLFPEDSYLHNVVLSLLGLSGEKWDFWRRLRSDGEIRDRAFEALRRVGLADRANTKVSETAYGERRRLELAMALAQNPKVLLLDEPLAGLSQPERRSVQELLSVMPADMAIVMIEHDMDVALAFAQQITVLNFGHVALEGTRADVVADPRTKEIYLGK